MGGCAHDAIPDRIEAGTMLFVAACVGSTLTLSPVIPEHMTATTALLIDAGCSIDVGDEVGGESKSKSNSNSNSNSTSRRRSMTITPPPRGGIRAVDFTTAPYPGVPTDMQPQLCVLNACAEGVAIVRETVFESRWSHVPELRRMGVECDFVDADGDDAVANANANANANAGRALRIVGVGARGLRRADVRGSDLRASAALIVAGLAVMAPMGDGDGDGDGDGEAQGPTRVAGLAHLDRGYEGLDAKLRGVGADVERRPVPPRK